MTDVIDSFNGTFRFLSNFYMDITCPIEYEGIRYPSTEHAYQAAKALNQTVRIIIAEKPTPGAAKRAGSVIPLRSDWEDVKVRVMVELVMKKFKNGTYLARCLDATEDADLIEGNTWGDQFWGVCDGIGRNMLGKILMAVREKNRHDGIREV